MPGPITVAHLLFLIYRWSLSAALYPRFAIPDPNNHQRKEQDCRCVRAFASGAWDDRDVRQRTVTGSRVGRGASLEVASGAWIYRVVRQCLRSSHRLVMCTCSVLAFTAQIMFLFFILCEGSNLGIIFLEGKSSKSGCMSIHAKKGLLHMTGFLQLNTAVLLRLAQVPHSSCI